MLGPADASAVTPLVAAAAFGSLEGVGALLDAGADPNATATNGATALHIAASMGGPALVGRLLSGGADPERTDRDGLKALHAAAVCEQREALELLLEATAPLPGVEWTVDGMLRDARDKDGYVADCDGGGVGGGGGGRAHAGMGAGEGGVGMLGLGGVVDAEAAKKAKASGDAAFKRGAHAEAAGHYAAAIAANPSEAVLHANASAALLKLGRYSEARESAAMARTLDPEYLKAFYREGLAYEKMELWEEAAQAFFEGCRLDPENQEIRRCFQEAIRRGRQAHQAQESAKKKGEEAIESGPQRDVSCKE